MEPAVNVPSLVVPATKLVPVTVIGRLDPATAVLGLREEIVGPHTETGDAAEEAPEEFCTVTSRLPALPIRLVGRVAVIEVAVPAVTVSAVVPA